MTRASSLTRRALDAVASLIFPAPCRICEATLVTASGIPVCAACLEAIQAITGPQCARCGRPFVAGAAVPAGAQCHLCRRGAYDFDAARSWATYNDTLTRAIVLLKYHAVTPLAGWLAGRLADLATREPQAFAADVVVPVPLHPARLRQRGHNQAELIARPLARRLGLPVKAALLARTRPRPEKRRLTRKERWSTVKGAYLAREGTVVDRRVLLVDDVFTTGATLDACSRALRKAGAARVSAVTVARVAPDWAPPQQPPARP